ncbi:MAG: nucleotidyltransferase domain-containing protein [Oscillospiraceae bacterium]|nr:nucleotidyltransferase domain-containing protein [Oscillospiraceae bacterium]
MNKSRERAMEILSIHLRKIQASMEDAVQSVVLVGSLTNGSYTADNGSDIDLIHILRDDAAPESRGKLLALIGETEAMTQRDIPISRCVYRYSHLFFPYPTDFSLCLENKDYIELPIEIMRMKDSGLTVWGEDILDAISYPRREDVLFFKMLSGKWAQLEAERGFRPIPDDQLPVRLIVQSVLVRAMLDYFLVTGASCSNKAAVAERLRRDVPEYALQELTEWCTRWRYSKEWDTAEVETHITELWPDWSRLRQGQGVEYVPMRNKEEQHGHS